MPRTLSNGDHSPVPKVLVLGSKKQSCLRNSTLYSLKVLMYKDSLTLSHKGVELSKLLGLSGVIMSLADGVMQGTAKKGKVAAIQLLQ